jgi:hypothetical protein
MKMTKSYDKSFYIVATKNGEHYFQEGSYSEQEINKFINEFNIDDFIANEATDEEYTGPAEGMYAIYRQSSMSDAEALALGAYVQVGDSIHMTGNTMTPENDALYMKRCDELQAEIDAEFGDAEPLVCLKSFATVVA